ncbi:MAG: hypothetical protein ACFFB5_07140 [Promethearchaeota archaeon]
MSRKFLIFLILALLFCGLGLHSLILFLIDPELNFIYGFISMGLLIPGSILFLAAFESKIGFLSNDSVKT